MILVDTSVWIDHLRSGNNRLRQLLSDNLVYIHPMIIGELACGNLGNRQQLLELWQNMPSITECGHDEVLIFLESHQLMGKGIGLIDLHLLASCSLMDKTYLWTKDKRLALIAQKLDINFIGDHA